MMLRWTIPSLGKGNLLYLSQTSFLNSNMGQIHTKFCSGPCTRWDSVCIWGTVQPVDSSPVRPSTEGCLGTVVYRWSATGSSCRKPGPSASHQISSHFFVFPPSYSRRFPFILVVLRLLVQFHLRLHLNELKNWKLSFHWEKIVKKLIEVKNSFHVQIEQKSKVLLYLNPWGLFLPLCMVSCSCLRISFLSSKSEMRFESEFQ